MRKLLIAPIALFSTFLSMTFLSCERQMSPDDPLPPTYKPSLYFASNNRNLYSVDVATNQTNWEFVADDAIKASPTIFGDHVILVSQRGTIYRISKLKGELVQKKELGVNIWATPTIYNEKLILCTFDGRIIAYNGNDLNEVFWTATGYGQMLGSPTVTRIGSSDVIGVVCANAANEVFIVNIEDGSLIWRKTMSPAGGIVSSVTASEYTVYASSTNGRLYSINTENGNVNWSYTTGGPITASPISIGGNVMVGSADFNFYSIDSLTGMVRWKVPAGDKIESTACYDNQYVYYGSNDQKIYCVDVIHGIKTWEKRTFSAVRSSPVVYDNKVYVGSYDQNLYILDAETGFEEAVLPVYGQMDCSPLIDQVHRIFYPPVSGNYFLK